MKQIIVALGHDRTVNELLNLIVSGTSHSKLEILNDEDEVVSVLIDRLLDISEALGNPAHNIILLPIFEALIQLETAALRDKVSVFNDSRLMINSNRLFQYWISNGMKTH